MAVTETGLCGRCRWMRVVTNRRGSVFYRCGLADRDSRFSKYPALPVLACPGFESATEDATQERGAPGTSRLEGGGSVDQA